MRWTWTGVVDSGQGTGGSVISRQVVRRRLLGRCVAHVIGHGVVQFRFLESFLQRKRPSGLERDPEIGDWTAKVQLPLTLDRRAMVDLFLTSEIS